MADDHNDGQTSLEVTGNDLQKSLAAAETVRPVRTPKAAPPAPKAVVAPPVPKAVVASPAKTVAATHATPGNVARALSPAAHQPAAKQVVVDDVFDHDTALHMSFLGSGQAGSRIAQAFWSLGYRRVGVFNTTEMDFEGIDAAMARLSLDVGGAAKDQAFARAQLKGRDEELWDLMTRAWGHHVDMALVCASLGGGTGGGTLVPLMRLARTYMENHGKTPRVGAIVSLPSVSEGQQVARNAVLAFRELMLEKAGPILIIDNARIHELYAPPMSQLLPKSNELISQLLHLFNTLAAVKSPYITFDRSELGQLLGGGIVVMGAADIPLSQVRSPADISQKIRDELSNNVLARVDVGTGKKAACLFVGGQEALDSYSLDYFEAGFSQLDRVVGTSRVNRDVEPTVIHRGLYLGEDAGLQCYVMISELEPPHARLIELAKKGGLTQATAVSSMAKFLGVDDAP